MFSSQKTAYRERYLKDYTSPTITILNTQYTASKTMVQIQIPVDVNQLYLITNPSDYQSSVITSTEIPLNTNMVYIEIQRTLLSNFNFYILAYDVAENPSTPILIEYK